MRKTKIAFSTADVSSSRVKQMDLDVSEIVRTWKMSKADVIIIEMGIRSEGRKLDDTGADIISYHLFTGSWQRGQPHPSSDMTQLLQFSMLLVTSGAIPYAVPDTKGRSFKLERARRNRSWACRVFLMCRGCITCSVYWPV